MLPIRKQTPVDLSIVRYADVVKIDKVSVKRLSAERAHMSLVALPIVSLKLFLQIGEAIETVLGAKALISLTALSSLPLHLLVYTFLLSFFSITYL